MGMSDLPDTDEHKLKPHDIVMASVYLANYRDLLLECDFIQRNVCRKNINVLALKMNLFGATDN